MSDSRFDRVISFLCSHAWAVDEVWGFQQLQTLFLHDTFKIEKNVHFFQELALSDYLDSTSIKTQSNKKILLARLSGTMTVDGMPCQEGVQALSDKLYAAYSNSDIAGIVLEVNSGGGHSIAGQLLHNTIQDRNKPVLAHGITVGSAAYMAAMASDHIMATDENAKFGSIGSYFSLSKAALEQLKNDTIDIYSAKSPDKNSELRQLIQGDFSGIQKLADESALRFQKMVSRSRVLNSDMADTTLSGGMFNAENAKKRGLIDSIGGRKKAIRKMNELINLYK